MKVRNKVKAKMANTFKKIIKKHKKKKLQAERNRKAKARERAEEEYADDYDSFSSLCKIPQPLQQQLSPPL